MFEKFRRFLFDRRIRFSYLVERGFFNYLDDASFLKKILY